MQPDAPLRRGRPLVPEPVAGGQLELVHEGQVRIGVQPMHPAAVPRRQRGELWARAKSASASDSGMADEQDRQVAGRTVCSKSLQ